MQVSYLGWKFFHILIAIVTLGTAASTGFLRRFAAGEPAHDEFVLRTIRRMTYRVVIPGYVLLLATGMWMGHVANLLDARWTEAAMHLWGIGALTIAFSQVLLHKQIGTLAEKGRAAPGLRRLAMLRWISGAATTCIVLVIIYFMVFKPGG
jgi:uncharacterized membrane protein